MSLIEQTQPPADILSTLGLDDNGRRRSWTRRILYSLIVVALVAAAFAVRGRQKAEGGTSYVTNPAQVGDLVETVSATGTLEALDTVEVGSETSGRILDVLVDFNDRVEKGQVLATIDPEQAAARSEEAAAQLRAARASVAIARALVTDPVLLVADEPTGNLDSATSDEVMQLMTDLNRERGVTIGMVTHEPDVAAWVRPCARSCSDRRTRSASRCASGACRPR